MWRCVVLSFALVLTLSCVTYNEGLRTAPESDLREEAFERARALYEVREHRAALRTLEKILTMKPFDELSVDAVVLAADICLLLKNPQKGLDLIRELEQKTAGKVKDSGRLAKKKETLSFSLAKKEIPETKLHDSITKDEVATPTEPSPVAVSQPVEKVVGILLPLTGSYEVYGKRALAAMSLAFGTTTQQNQDGVLILDNPEGVRAIVLDTKGNADFAKTQVDVLVDRFHVSVIVGDILSDTSVAIAAQAEKRRALNLSLSRKDGVTTQGNHVFHLGMTPKKQVRELLRNRENDDTKHRYAVLYPENGFGIEMKDAFISEAKALGHSVVKVVGYKPNETTFTSHIKQLAGAKRTSGNPMFEECSEKANRIKDNQARKKAEKDCYDAVVPSIGFEGIFIPEFPKTLAYIVPALISEGIMVSQNEDMVRAYRRTSRVHNATPVQLLGPSSWNNPVVGEKLGAQVDGALFVDSADMLDEKEDVKNFVKAFTESQQSGPSSGEAYAFDAMRVVRDLFSSKEEERLQFNRISLDLQSLNHEGIVGKITFDHDRELIVPFRRLSFQDGKIVPQS